MGVSEFLQDIMHSDRFRLSQQVQRLKLVTEDWKWLDSKIQVEPSEVACRSDVEKLRQSIHQSQRTFQKRSQSVPKLEYDSELPISAHREQIMELLQSRQTLVICGETGSGKSTQLPKICLDAGLGRAGMIGHTQPRRLAARAVASRLAEELETRIGELVGFKIRFSDATSTGTLVKVMTDGVLLAETQSDRYLEQYDVLIIDEAHERSLNIDFLLGYLRRIQTKRPELKLIITSATIDPQRFADHFSDTAGPAPILEVSGRTYPVEVRYRPIGHNLNASDSLLNDRNNEFDDEELYRSIAAAADELWNAGTSPLASGKKSQELDLVSRSPRGDILVFLPTERDIRLATKTLRGHFSRQASTAGVEILPLYARLSQAEQNKIFAIHSGRRIVLATNVAESSLTVPGIHYVIDSGLVRLSRYSSRSKVQRLPIEPVSQASANQRSGRCGRLGPGICIRLYEHDDYQSRPRFTTPEIRRSDLANVLLQSYMLKLGPLDEFPLLDMPTPESLRDAHQTLRELGALDNQHRLTDLGKQLGRLPCDARVGRMLLEAHQRNCLAEVIIIAAGLETSDVRQRPAGQAPQADAAHQRFKDPHSDFLSFIRLWDFYENLGEQLGRGRLQKALQQNFLSLHGFREWAEIIRQLKELLASAGFKIGHRRLELAPIPREGGQEKVKAPRPEGYAAIHQSLLTGLLSGIAERDQQRFEYKAAGGLSIQLWPGSGLFRQSPKWIMAAEIVETSQRFGRIVGELDVAWIEHAGSDLLKHTYYDPFWSEKTGAGMVYRKSTLYGLAVVVGRRIPLVSINVRMARDMLIEHGLVDGKWQCSLPFYIHNREMLADVEELARRTRSRQYVVDRYSMMQFYSTRLPELIGDLQGLQNWATRQRGSQEEQALWLQPHDLLDSASNNLDIEVAFPNTLKLGTNEFPLTYHFEPGHEMDGVTISLPQIALRQVNEDLLAWLVPGLLEQKILAALRALPKSLRTSFLPAPDVARKLVGELSSISRDSPFSVALAHAMSKHCGQPIRPSQLNFENLPDSLRFRIQVIDDSGKSLGIDRNLNLLVSRFGLNSQAVLSTLKTDAFQWTNRVIRDSSDLDGLPSEVPVTKGGVTVSAYVAIVDTGTNVEARLVDTQQEASRLTGLGLLRKLAIKNDRLLRSHVKNLPQFQESALSLGNVLDKGRLQQALQDLIVRIALLEDRSLPRDAATFEARQAEAVKQISMAAQEVAQWLPGFARSYQQLRLSIEQAPKSWHGVTDSIRNQLDDLFQKSFILTTPWKWLKEYPRYLQAAKLRMDKLASGGLLRDKKLAEPLLTARMAFRELLELQTSHRPAQSAALEELRWALEEYQVSLFAQQLGTKLTVSEKRITEMITAIRQYS